MCLISRSESRTVSQCCYKKVETQLEQVGENTIKRNLQFRLSFLVSSEDPLVALHML